VNYCIFLMLKRKFSEADLFLIIANILPVYGVWFLGWKAAEVFLVYCLETVIIGLFTLMKLAIATYIRKTDLWENEGSRTRTHGGFFILFFIIHYGLFVGIQTTLFLNITYSENAPNILEIMIQPTKYLGNNAWLMMCLFVFGYGYENLSRFMFYNEYRTHSFVRIMFEPYIRIFIQQITVIAGGIILSFGAGNVFILLFALIKIIFTILVDYEKVLNRSIEKVRLSGKQ
jgi:hypothetical protein